MELTSAPMTQSHLFELLTGAIIFAGVLGGLLNFYLTQRSDPEDSSLGKSIVLGIGASFLVPLFLNTISSKLLDEIRTTADDRSKNVLVFLGFCLVAAISSKAFIQTISKRILAKADKALQKSEAADKKASEVESAVAPILVKATEGEEEAKSVSPKVEAVLPELSDREWQVLEALANGEKALRTRHSLARETGINYDEVRDIADRLREKGFAASKDVEMANGTRKRWYITANGRDIVEARLIARSIAPASAVEAPQN